MTKYDEECNPNHCDDGMEPNILRGPVCCPIKENVKTHTEACVPDTCDEGYTLDVPNASATGCCPPVDNAETLNGSDCVVATCNFGFVLSDDLTGCVVPSLADGNCPIIAHVATYTATCGVEKCEGGFKLSADATTCEVPLVVDSGSDDGFNPLWLLLLLLIPSIVIPVVLFLRSKKQGVSRNARSFMETSNTDEILAVRAESEKVASEKSEAAGENGAREQEEDFVFDL